MPKNVLKDLTSSELFDLGRAEYRAVGLLTGEVALLLGEDVYSWGETLIKTF